MAGRPSLIFESESVDFVCQVEDVAIIERHVVAVTTKDEQVVLEDDSCVSVSCRWSLTLDVENLCVLVSANHRRETIRLRSSTHSLPLAHLLIVLIEVASIVVLDQERTLHVFRSWRVESDLALIFQTLSLLQ